MRIASLVSLAVVSPLLVAAAQPLRLQPSSPWVLDYAENSCRLMRTFGDGSDKTQLLLESEAPGEMDLVVVGKPLYGDSQQVPATFLPVQSKPMDGRRAKTVGPGDPGVLWPTIFLVPKAEAEKIEEEEKQAEAHSGVRPPPLDLAEVAAKKSQRLEYADKTNELEIEPRRGRQVILETGSLGDPIRLFDKCSRDSLRDWGVDPDLEDKIVRPVWAANPRRWFTPADYPNLMLRTGAESEVSVRLLVDASGKVTKCTSLSHFEAPEFNQIVCDAFMKRAHFEPAELGDGTKVPSYYTKRIRFQISS